jgi:hypothetical protein
MAVQPETVLVKAIKTAILAAHPDAVVYKIHGGPAQEAGIPDLICCVQGRFIGLEVKRRQPSETEMHAYGRTTEIQAYQRDRIRAAGGWCSTVLSVDEALAHVEQAILGENPGED